MITGIRNLRAGCEIQGTTTVNAWSDENYNTLIMIRASSLKFEHVPCM